MAHTVVDESWIREIYDDNTDGSICNLTFCGVLEQLYRAISFNWKSASTRKLNAAAYNNIILPELAIMTRNGSEIIHTKIMKMRSGRSEIEDTKKVANIINILNLTIKGFENLFIWSCFRHPCMDFARMYCGEPDM